MKGETFKAELEALQASLDEAQTIAEAGDEETARRIIQRVRARADELLRPHELRFQDKQGEKRSD